MLPEHRPDAIVKFRLKTRSGDIENVWGDLLELGETEAEVDLRTPPVGEVVETSRRMTVPVGDLVDWQIILPDGTLRGGFTKMVHSLPRSRAHASRPPMSGLPKLSSHALAGSSAITQVMERLIVPCVGMDSIGLRLAQPVPAAASKPTTMSSAFSFNLILLLLLLPARTEVEQGYRQAWGDG